MTIEKFLDAWRRNAGVQPLLDMYQATLTELAEVTQERDELLKRAADLSWEIMSPRERAVWSAAFAWIHVWDGKAGQAFVNADAAVKALREALK